jgi:fermentation-respiration switch protein FrsA (DUF1100 family)
MLRRRYPAFVVAGLLAGAAGCVCLENALLYHPTRDTDPRPVPPGSTVQDLKLRTADGTLIHARWCPCAGAQGALLFCHGNAGNLFHRARTIADLKQALGESVLIFDYPGYGRSEGEPSEAGCYLAANAAYDWLIGQRIAPEQIVIFGESLGGGVAVELAHDRPHRALILLSTFTSIPDMAATLFPWLPVRWLVETRFDNLARIGECSRPVFIAHGTCDRTIPFVQGERLFAAAHEPKQFFRMEGHDHNDPPGPAVYAALREFLESQAPVPGPAVAATPRN